MLVFSSQTSNPEISLVKFKRLDNGEWEKDGGRFVEYNRESQGFYNYTTEIGKPLQSWIKDNKVILVLSKTVLVYNYADLELIHEIKLKEVLPAASFYSCASLANDAEANSGPGKLCFWLGAVGPRRRVSALPNSRVVKGKTFSSYSSYAVKMIWTTDAATGKDALVSDASDAVILEKEYILCLNEYSAGSLAVTCEKRENIFNIVQG